MLPAKEALRILLCTNACAPQYVKVGIVGGSDQAKICEQLGGDNGALYSRKAAGRLCGTAS